MTIGSDGPHALEIATRGGAKGSDPARRLDGLLPPRSLTGAGESGSAALGAPAATASGPPSLLDALTGNPYFSAGFGLLGVGTGLAALRAGLVHGTTFAKRRLLVSLEIPSRDKSYGWFLGWMSAQTAAPRSRLAQRMAPLHELSVETHFKQLDNGFSETAIEFVPGPGSHWLKYQGAWFRVARTRSQRLIDMTSARPWETVVITTLSRDRDLLRAMLLEAQQDALRKEEGKLLLYTSWGPEWRPFGAPRRRRPLSSVTLDRGLADVITGDVGAFLANAAWYHDRGIPYRRGYLLYGPPGSGKSSFIQALAGHLEYNICILNLSDAGLTDDRLSHLLTVAAPPRSLMLLEDVDAAFTQREAGPRGSHSMVTFSGLLNALDGVAAAEERLIFMTTNHIDRLDAALIRPGRVDFKAFIGNASEYQVREMVARFYPPTGPDPPQRDWGTELVDAMAAKNMLGVVSTATLQGHFVRFRDDPQGAIENAHLLHEA